jgi:enoyl-CoA hydratase
MLTIDGYPEWQSNQVDSYCVGLEGLMGEFVELTVDGDIAEIMFVRPESMNKWTAQTHSELATTFYELRGSGLRAAVLGATGPIFSAGGDFDYLNHAHLDRNTMIHGLVDAKKIIEGVINLDFPVVAAVQGPAAGGSASLIMACDLIVAARSAFILDPHVPVGIVAGDGGCLSWPVAAGMMTAKRYLMTGDRFSAEDAYRLGVVSELVERPEDMLPAARKWAEKFASLPPLAVQGTKRSLNNMMKARSAEVFSLAFAEEVFTVLSDDFPEAIAAAKEKRRGNYTGQ